EEEAFKEAKSFAAEEKRLLWICNTVRRAQNVFQRLEDFGLNVRTYHSRFKYEDRRDRHREIVDTFASETRRSIVAVTTQVAEMSLDLDADVLITEISPIPALIQRLGRLNRRVTPENPGTPRTAYFVKPDNSLPYTNDEVQLAEKWIDELAKLNR